MAVTSQWQFASDEDWALALARAAVIRPLSDQAELTEGLVATARRRAPSSGSLEVLVYRLVAKFRKRPQVSSLLPSKRGRKAVDVSLTISPILDSSGRIVGASKIARDITERKEAETATRRAQEQLEE